MFMTTDHSMYMKYKSALRSYGFVLEREEDGVSSYTYGKYSMMTAAAKNGSNITSYAISLFLDK
ncbi:hypothetical protein GCM10023093_18190 [Nemorincola caseinilytica]|uniref:Uncharacterized protein n=2 Tax=Nemorincola caseinilytica TaxID=2054315 RepID=A0ABP8NGY9_9BACT